MTALGPALLAAVAGLLPLAASAQATAAPPWERVGLYEGRTLYIDPTTTRRSGSRIQVFAVTDLREPNATARGRQYRSKKALLEFDCSARTLRVLQDSWHPRQMAQGEPVFQTDGPQQSPLPIQSDSPSEMLWKAACGVR